MKATLEFNLPEERQEHMMAVLVGEMYQVLWEIDQQCRSWLKHGHEISAEQVMEWVRAEVSEVLAKLEG